MPEELQPAQTLKAAYRYLDPLRPLEGEWLKAFYVERPPDSRVDRLLDELLLDDSEDDKTLFSGQQGAGESTELHRLSEALQDSHITIFFNAEKMLNLGDVHYADLLVLLGLEGYREARNRDIPADDEKAQALRFWYEERFLEQDESQRLRSEVSGEVTMGVLRIGARLSQEEPFRQTVRAKTEAGLADLLDRLNGLLTDLRQRFGRRILVVVDGLDKVYDLRRAVDLFLYGANALVAPACRIIYTIPYPLFYSPDFQQVRQQFHRNYLLPNVKVQERRGTPYPPGREMLRQVLLRRVSEALIAPEALEALIEASGGLIRELLRLARLAVASAQSHKEGRVTLDDVAEARREVRNSFRRILKAEDYRHLWRLRETRRLDELPPEAADKLLHNLSVLEYDGESWWDVHPAVKELMDEADTRTRK
ncbi:MAG: hypothetical protein KatS3mg131_1863 [Candidatus Tectimicrobiota bacterium]|nr:MAG: hypothetical protein KatS3mg131_1863 [Candidatus Tectomicrobia bacterium]